LGCEDRRQYPNSGEGSASLPSEKRTTKKFEPKRCFYRDRGKTAGTVANRYNSDITAPSQAYLTGDCCFRSTETWFGPWHRMVRFLPHRNRRFVARGYRTFEIVKRTRAFRPIRQASVRFTSLGILKTWLFRQASTGSFGRVPTVQALSIDGSVTSVSKEGSRRDCFAHQAMIRLWTSLRNLAT
jgi:hypothetical protein